MQPREVSLFLRNKMAEKSKKNKEKVTKMKKVSKKNNKEILEKKKLKKQEKGEETTKQSKKDMKSEKNVKEQALKKDIISEQKNEKEEENEKKENKKLEDDSKKETKDKKVNNLKEKDKAIANGYSLRISMKSTKYICKMIKGKDVNRAIRMLEEVIAGKRAVKMVGLEVGHRKGKGMSGGRYPKNAAVNVLAVVKQLKANSVVNSIENPVITLAISNKAHSPQKRGGKQSKRTHLYLEAKEKNKLLKRKK